MVREKTQVKGPWVRLWPVMLHLPDIHCSDARLQVGGEIGPRSRSGPGMGTGTAGKEERTRGAESAWGAGTRAWQSAAGGGRKDADGWKA
jgi:hypothetical protein